MAYLKSRNELRVTHPVTGEVKTWPPGEPYVAERSIDGYRWLLGTDGFGIKMEMLSSLPDTKLIAQ